MSPAPAQSGHSAPLKAGSWSFYSAFAVSTVIHAVLLLACWWLLIAADAHGQLDGLSGAWSDTEAPELQLDPPAEQPQPLSLQSDPGTTPGTLLVRDRTVKTTVQQPTETRVITREGDPVLFGSLAEDVGALRGNGNGDGTGTGGGADAGKGFFGMKPEVNSTVFVVDCSGSMNLQHPSAWKTRFRRLKVELLRSISGMRPEQRFYIIFFNDGPIRMPAPTLQAAVPRNKRRFLEWMAKQKAVGQTDPRGAMKYALALQPDVIYFLTDGAFAFKMKRDLLNIRQSRVAIHTFAFSNRTGEDVMKQIAKQNGGKYHFVP